MPKQKADDSPVRTRALSQDQLSELCSILVRRKISIDLRALSDNSLELTGRDRGIAIEAVSSELAELDDGRTKKQQLKDLLDQLKETTEVHTPPGIPPATTSTTVNCSFCCKAVTTGGPSRMVAGPNVFICRDCIGLCIEIMAHEAPEWLDEKVAAARQPHNKS